MKSLYRKLLSIGPGGWKCPCCGSKDRKEARMLRKETRRRLKEELRNEEHT